MEISLARDPHWVPHPDKPVTWAQAKCEHAVAQSLELQRRMKHYFRTLPDDMYEHQLSEDRLSFSTRLAADFPRPPTQEWSLLLGDVIHNLRASMDAVVWAHADSAAMTESEAKKVRFPLCRSEEQWLAARPINLRTVPDDVAARIYEDQPLHLEEPERAVLNLLHSLDIQDKHREMLGTRAACVKFEYFMRVATFRDPPDHGEIQEPGIERFELEPGALVLRGTSPVPIRRIHGSMHMTPDVGFAPELRIGESVLELLAGLTNQVRAVVHNVEGHLAELVAQLDLEADLVRRRGEHEPPG